EPARRLRQRRLAGQVGAQAGEQVVVLEPGVPGLELLQVVVLGGPEPLVVPPARAPAPHASPPAGTTARTAPAGRSPSQRSRSSRSLRGPGTGPRVRQNWPATAEGSPSAKTSSGPVS